MGIDAFVFGLAVILGTLSVFLLRDYTRFLSGIYSLPAQVVSIQQVFVPKLLSADMQHSAYVANGFYPVVEYRDGKDRVPFTAIDEAASGRFHVGDRLKLKVSKSRRKMQRNCRSVRALLVLVVALIGSLAFAAMSPSVDLSLTKVIAASFILTIVAMMLIVYSRDQEEHAGPNQHESNGDVQLHLYEPTACAKWDSVFLDKQQRHKIRGVKLFGCCCFTSAMAMLVLALQPTLFF